MSLLLQKIKRQPFTHDEMDGAMGHIGFVAGMSETDEGSQNYDAIASAMESAVSEGLGRLRVPAGTYGFNQPIVEDQGLLIEGHGGGFERAGGWDDENGDRINAPEAFRRTALTRFKSTAAVATGDLITFTSPEVTPARAAMVGGGIRGIMLDGNSKSNNALVIRTRRGLIVDDVSLCYSLESLWLLDVITDPILSGGTYGTRENVFSRIMGFNGCGTSSPEFACKDAYGLRTKVFEAVDDPSENESDALGNPTVCFNRFDDIRLVTKQQTVIRLEGATDNLFQNVFTRCQDDPMWDTYYGWELCSADQDTRLGLAVAKRNTLVKCGGLVHARAGQSGGGSSFGNRIIGHQTSTRLAFKVAVVYEAPAGGSKVPDCWAETELGSISPQWSYATYQDIKDRYMRGGIVPAVFTLNTPSGASVTATGVFPPAGSQLMGWASRVRSRSAGPTSYDLGDGTDVDRYADGIAYSENETSDMSDAAADSVGGGFFKAAGNLVATANGSNWTGGSLEIGLWYFTTQSVFNLATNAIYRTTLYSTDAVADGGDYEFINASIGVGQTNRVVVACTFTDQDVSGLTIGGVAATEIGAVTVAAGQYIHVFALSVTGTDTLSDVVVTITGGAGAQCVLTTYAVYSSSATPVDVVTATASGTTNATAEDFEVIDGGSAVIFGVGAYPGPLNLINYTTTNPDPETQRIDFRGDFDTTVAVIAGHINTTANVTDNAITLSETTSGAKAFIVATFGT